MDIQEIKGNLPKTIASSSTYQCMHDSSGMSSKYLMDQNDLTKMNEIVDNFDSQFESFITQRSSFLSQLKEETDSLVEKHKTLMIAERKKHAACEEKYRHIIQLEKNNVKELSDEQKILKEKLSDFEEKLQKKNHELEQIRMVHEGVIKEKNENIVKLQTEKRQIEISFNSEKIDLSNQKRKLEDKNTELQEAIGKSEEEIKDLKFKLVSLDAKNKYLTDQLDTSVKNLTEQKQLNDSLKDEIEEFRRQLHIESNLNQENANLIRSLTESRDEHKIENERLEKNIKEVELKRLKEIKDYESKFTIRKNNYEQDIQKIKVEKIQIEQKLKQQIADLKKDVRYLNEDKDKLNTIIEQRNTEKLHLESQIQQMSHEHHVVNESHNTSTLELQSKIDELERELEEEKNKQTTSLLELDTCQNRITSLEGELYHAKNEIASLEELSQNYVIKFDKLADIRKIEKSQMDAKSIKIEDLNDQLISLQSDIDKLKDTNEELLRSQKDGDTERETLLKERENLLKSLSDAEKSKLELRSKISTAVIAENRLKIKENELIDLRRNYEKQKEDSQKEIKRLTSELESSNKSMIQMKHFNETLNQKNSEWRKRITELEGLEIDRRISSVDSGDSDIEKRRLKRSIDTLKDENNRIKNENRRIQRSYADLEQKYNSFIVQAKAEPVSKTMNITRYTNGENSSLSILSPSKMQDSSFFNLSYTTKLDFVNNEVLKYGKGIEDLHKRSLSIKKGIHGVERTLEAASSKSGTGDESTFDEEEIRNNFEKLDYNDNDMIQSLSGDEKLKQAQLRAKNLIEESSMWEKEHIKSARKQRTQSPKLLDTLAEQ